MSSLTSPFAAKSSENIAEPTRMKVLREGAVIAAASPASDFYDQQIQALVQQVFFQPSATSVRHIGIASVEPDTETAQLCLDVGLALAALGPHDVGLVDVRLQAPPLHTQLKIAGEDANESRQIGPNLWLAPRRSWLDDSPQGMWDHSLGRLRATTLEFDFSILCLDPISWLTPKISKACDGLIIVLTANKTRRLVAVEIQERLRRGQVPVLGSILADRRFPVPEGLYRNL
jgi:Mrp family chromosome partitioning ATPase